MAFSASDWAYRLSEWSGSAQGNKSWSGLGRSTRIGGYFNYFYKPNGTQINFVYRGDSYPNQSPTAERNVEPYYMYAYYVNYVYAYFYDSNCGYTYVNANYSTYNYFNVYVGQGAYTGYAASMPAPSYTSYGFSTFYTLYQNYGAYSAANSWSPSTFYNYSPWGAGPYSAGSNISIGNGIYSGYPYQYIHT